MTTNNIPLRFFRFGGILHEAHQDVALQLTALEDELNAKAPVADFADVLEQLYFIPILIDAAAVPSSDHETLLRYDAAAKKLLIQKPVAPGSDLRQALLEGVRAAAAEVGALVGVREWLEKGGD